MNDKYVKLSDVKRKLRYILKSYGVGSFVREKIKNALNDLPYSVKADLETTLEASDVQPAKRGEWDFRGYQLFKCTNCKEIFTQNQLEVMQNHIDQEEFTFPNFCPNCGADMRGDTENG